jgi:hypothetical protein
MPKTIVNTRVALLWFVTFSVGITLALLSLRSFVPEILSPNYLWYFIFNFSVYALALYVLLMVSRKHDAEKFVMIFLVTTVGKMLLAMIFILIMIMNTATQPVLDAILFMSIYLLYLMQELLVLFKARKVENS